MSKALVCAGCFASLILGGTAAEARIVCHDGFQVVGGSEISTPYCNDGYMADVARQRGFKVTAEAVRNNPSLKDEICRWIGSDIRIRQYCNTSDGPDRGR